MRMPMGQRELDDIVDEIDVDGNGAYAVSLYAIDARQQRADGVDGARHAP